MDLEKYYDIYDISDVDFTEAMLGYSEEEFDDNESVRVLKILAARFYMSRKILLCCLMALDAQGGKSDLIRWNMASEEMRAVTLVTSEAEDRLHHILSEEESRFHHHFCRVWLIFYQAFQFLRRQKCHSLQTVSGGEPS
jgi:hypothetical protein